jgi:hypothetical protein
MTLKCAGGGRIMASPGVHPDANRETMEDKAVKDEGNVVMEQHNVGSRLTPTQLAIRDRCGQLPKRLQRSIDQFRQSVDLPPLWAGLGPTGCSRKVRGRP